jgi:hypothetical protein
MTLFFLSGSAEIAELEGLIVAAAKPPGNKQKPLASGARRISRQLQAAIGRKVVILKLHWILLS